MFSGRKFCASLFTAGTIRNLTGKRFLMQRKEKSMPEEEMIVQCKHGLHARPASMIVEQLEGLNIDYAEIICGAMKADCKNIIELLTLYAEFGIKVTVRIQGVDEHKAMMVIKRALSGEFNSA
jgi:phosphotransferase system HPr (HPr) family protein